MENSNISTRPFFNNDPDIIRTYSLPGGEPESATDHLFKKLAAENCENFYNYLYRLGMTTDHETIILAARHHYYYDAEELKEIKTIVNLKELNHIKQLLEFFYDIFRILPDKSFFVGCFIDNKKQNGFANGSYKSDSQINALADIKERNSSGIPFLNMKNKLWDYLTKRYLTKKSVTLLLEEALLKVMDMTEIKGLTYFCTQKVQILGMND
jgi:hypothetical protein